MLNQLDTPTTSSTTIATQNPEYFNHTTTFHDMYSDEFDTDSNCSTPYVSAPSSPTQYKPPANFFYYSAPASPVHYIISSPAATSGSKNSSVLLHSETSPASSTCSFEFDFSATLTTNGSASPGSLMTMISADELFLNGQIRPKDFSDERSRSSKYRDKSRRRTRSMSPLRTRAFDWKEDFEIDKNEHEQKKSEVLVSTPAPESSQCEIDSSPPRSSSVGRSSRKWVFLKEFLYRSKSEGRNNGNKFWGSLSFSPVKDKIKTDKFSASKIQSNVSSSPSSSKDKVTAASISPQKVKQSGGRKDVKKKTVNGIGGKRRIPPPSAHELHYTTNRAQAEEMRKKTYLPYKQGLFGCLGFNSKSYYGAMNGFARTLNPVPST